MNLKIRRIRKNGSSVNSNVEPVVKQKVKPVISKKTRQKEPEKLVAIPVSKNNEVKVEKVSIKNTSNGLRNARFSDVLIYLHEKYNGNWDAIHKAIEEKERVDCDKVVKLVDSKMKDYDYTTIMDGDYPEECMEMKKPPFVIKRKKYSDDKEY